MSWLNLNQSLNSLKGQITNFASEVLSEGIAEDPGEGSSGSDASFKRLEEKCRDHELQIAALKKVNEELEATLQAERLTKKNGIKDDESNWYWDPPSQSSNQPKTIEADLEQQYLQQIHALQAEISTLRERNNDDAKPFVDNVEEEINRLREENKNLTTSLEDLDNQHQLAMERLLGLKRDLQTNFELLKQEHETLKNDNDQYSTENKELLTKIEDKQRVIDSMSTIKSDYDTLHHKYQNLERIHSLLRENAEKFQEENQELHEEVFKLQEQVTKLEHDLEIVIKQRDTSNTVPREKHEEVLKELDDLKERQNSSQIQLDEINADDNAKIVIENLKREINELKHKLQAKPDTNDTDPKVVKSEKITQLYNKYVNFELPIDYVGEIPSTDNNTVLYKLESVFKTLNSFKKDMDILHQKLSEKNLNINHLQAQIDDLTTENDFLTTDIQHYERELGDMKKNNDFLLAEIAVLKSTSKLEPIIETHEDSLGKLETELADCNRINRTFESELRRIEIELDEVRTEKTVLQESLNDLRNKYTTLLSELEIFKTQAQAVEELECNATVKQAEQLRRTTDEIDDLRKRLNCAFAKNEQLSIDIHIIENDKVLLTNEVDELKLSLVAKSSMCRDLEATNISLQQRLQEFERDFTELSNQKEELKQKLRNIEGRKSSNEDASQVPELNSNTEVADLLDKLDETVKENNYMKETIDGLTNELMALKVHERELISRNSSLKSCRATYLQNASKLHQTIKYLKAKLVTIDTLSNIVNDLENENKTLVEMKVKLEAELSICHATVARLEEEHEVFLTNFYEKCSTIDSLNVANENFSKSVIDLEYKLDAKDQELESLKHSLTEVSNKLAEVTGNLETAGKSSANNEDLDKLISEKEELTKIISAMTDEVNAKHVVNKNLNAQIEEIKGNCDAYKGLLDDKEKEIVELNQFIEELTEKIKTTEKMVKDEIAKKEELSKSSQNDIEEIKIKYDQLESSCVEYKTMLDKAASEKNELISLVNSKHNESVQYHNEINRLNHVLLEQAQEFHRKEREMSSQNSSENLSVMLKERDETIVELKKQIESYTKANAELNENYQNLTKKYDATEKSLSQQLEAVKKVTAENIQLSERSENLTRELERLRQHLMETEENYTQELMASEQKLTECQTRLHQVEERAKQTSNVYTSNSIRANQEVETLRNQIKLLEKQREDVQSKLSDAEDARSRSEAALVNLQVVLEQFQSDKERDIDASTEKIKNKMLEMRAQNDELKSEIAQLNLKLNEAQAGLQAATRLGDQVENKTAQINDLKEQVRALQTSVSAAEERYYNAVSNQQDKVDKNLVKNLVINYVMTAANSAHNKSQVLRIMSTVLDFNQQECEKLGLVRNSSAPDSLAAEFVKFLQNESRPRPPLPNMMTLAQNSSRNSTPASRRNSGLGPHPNPYDVGHKRNPSTGSNNLLFQNMESVEHTATVSTDNEETRVSLETGVNQTRNTEGAILKHVLKDM